MPGSIRRKKSIWKRISRPLLRSLWYGMGNNGSNGEGAGPQNISEDSETIVVICNRSGTENGATFAGSSSLFRLRQNI
ncbi:hypothetical protein BGY98DRAFT_51913, partial [Russula aff. rugulosa BPL654]